MKRIFLGSVLLLGLWAGPGWGADFSLVLNDVSAQGRLNYVFDKNDYGDSFASLRVLYNDDKDTLLGTVSGGVIGEPGNIPGLKIGAEILGNLGSNDHDRSLMTVGLGLLVNYQPAQLQGLGFFGRAQYAPKLLCFLDSEGMFEASIGASYMVTPKATILLEYQNTDVHFENVGSTDIDNSVRAGILFHF